MMKIPAFVEVNKGDSNLETVFLLRESSIQDLNSVVEQILVVGRDPDCDINLQHPTVSERHLRVHSSLRSVCIVDLSSDHGTWIRGIMVKPGEKVRLDEGDSVNIGDSSYVFQWVTRDSETKQDEKFKFVKDQLDGLNDNPSDEFKVDMHNLYRLGNMTNDIINDAPVSAARGVGVGTKTESESLRGNTGSNTKNDKLDPFGNARPGEEVLAGRGLDWKKVDIKIEDKKVSSRPSSSHSNSRSGNDQSERSGVDRWTRGVRVGPRDFKPTERHRLVLDLPKGGSESLRGKIGLKSTDDKPSPFGNARPREEILSERGLDLKKVDLEIEAKKVNRRPASSHSNSRLGNAQSGRSGEASGAKLQVVEKPNQKVNPFGDAKPREVLFKGKGIDYLKIDLELDNKLQPIERPSSGAGRVGPVFQGRPGSGAGMVSFRYQDEQSSQVSSFDEHRNVCLSQRPWSHGDPWMGPGPPSDGRRGFGGARPGSRAGRVGPGFEGRQGSGAGMVNFGCQGRQPSQLSSFDEYSSVDLAERAWPRGDPQMRPGPTGDDRRDFGRGFSGNRELGRIKFVLRDGQPPEIIVTQMDTDAPSTDLQTSGWQTAHLAFITLVLTASGVFAGIIMNWLSGLRDSQGQSLGNPSRVGTVAGFTFAVLTFLFGFYLLNIYVEAKEDPSGTQQVRKARKRTYSCALVAMCLLLSEVFLHNHLTCRIIIWSIIAAALAYVEALD